MKYRKGFTLIEIIMVTAIVGVLASVVMVAYPNSQKRARDTTRLNDLDQYRSQIEIYADSKNNGFYPIRVTATEISNLCDAAILNLTNKQCADDPKAPAQHYWYQSDANGTRFVVWGNLEISTNTYLSCSNGLAGESPTTTTDGSCPLADIPTNTPPPPLPPTNTPVPTATNTPLATPTNTPFPTNTPAATATPTPSTPTEITYTPSDDGFTSAGYPNSIHGSDPTVIASSWNSSNIREGFIKFDISSATNITAAKLRLIAYLPRKVDKYIYTSDTSWSESTLNYNTRPSVNQQIGYFDHLSTTLYDGEVIEITLDHTKLVKDANGFVSIAVINASSTNTLEFYSKESGNTPELILTVN